MQKRAPTLANILVICLFALSVFGLLLFLWETFGGSAPLEARGYRFTVTFPRTLELAEQSEVKISGVPVGHVISLKSSPEGLTRATIEIDSRYAPLRVDDHVILRQKTLLGETYVQVKPGGSDAPALRDGAELGRANVEPFVTLDDILATFSPEVRQAFRTWMQASAESFNGQGEALNLSFASIHPFIESANRVLKVLVSQQGAVRALVRDTGAVFDALTERTGQLREFTVGGNETFSAAARASRQWASAFKQLPAFERNSSAALRSLDALAADANPLLVQLRPAERALTPLLRQTERFAPPFDSFLTALGPLTKAGKSGLPALSKSLALTSPLLEALRPVLHNIDPFLQYTDEYLPSLQAFFANLTAASQATIGNSNVRTSSVRQHYLRSGQYIGPESLAVYSKRIGTNRANPYTHPGAFSELGSGLPVFSAANCANSAPSVEDHPNGQVSQQLIEQLIELKVVNPPASTSNTVPAPGCKQQGPFTFNAHVSQFPHVSYSE